MSRVKECVFVWLNDCVNTIRPWISSTVKVAGRGAEGITVRAVEAGLGEMENV